MLQILSVAERERERERKVRGSVAKVWIIVLCACVVLCCVVLCCVPVPESED